MRKITFISAYYENPQMLQKQVENIYNYPQHVKDNLEVIFVDDCSQDHPAKEVLNRLSLGCDLKLYRALVDVRWNQDFCRNLAASKAKHPWLFLTDIDHLLPEETLSELMEAEYINETLTYRFGRLTYPEMTAYKHHPNTWFMHKSVWDKTGGYDERFRGFYGTDGDFASRVKRASEIVQIDDLKVLRVPREAVPDASTTRYGRKEEIDKTITQISKDRAKIKGWKPENLLTPWEEVELY